MEENELLLLSGVMIIYIVVSILFTVAVDTALKNLCDYDPSNHFTVKVLRKHDDGGLFDKVPMLNYVSRHGYGGLGDDEAKHIVEYINHFAS